MKMRTAIILYCRIEAMNYDGSCRKELIMLPYQVYGLTFHENMLYFSYWDEPSVRVYDVMRNETRIVANYRNRTFGVTVYKPKDMCKLSFIKIEFLSKEIWKFSVRFAWVCCKKNYIF